MKIIRGAISNWKSFPYTEAPEWIEYGALNILIGANSHGKSNYLNTIRSIFHTRPDYFNSDRVLSERDLNRSDKPFQIIFEVETETGKRIVEKNGTYLELKNGQIQDLVVHEFKKGVFPLGVNRIITEWAKQKAFDDTDGLNLKLAQLHWNRIQADFLKYFNIRLSERPPQADLTDVSDDKGVRLNEIGSGHIGVFYFMLELIKQRPECQVFLFEEPENHMHPGLQIDFIKYLISLVKLKKYQFFITTHSSVFIDDTLMNGVDSKILHVIKENGESRIGSISNNTDEKVRLLYDQLGYKPSQILLSNCIIWVEGPSDRIYLNKWILDRNNLLEEFKHYTIMFYGGSLLSHLTYDADQPHPFVDFSTISRNAAIIFDGDKKSEGDKSQFSRKYKTKEKIAEEIKKRGGYSWITSAKEIENYIEKTLFEQGVQFIHTTSNYVTSEGKFIVRTKLPRSAKMKKVEVAKRLVSIAGSNKLVSGKETAAELDREIDGLINWIKYKNGLP